MLYVNKNCVSHIKEKTMTDQSATAQNPFLKLEETHQNILSDAPVGNPTEDTAKDQEFWKQAKAAYALDEYAMIDDPRTLDKIVEIGRAHDHRYAPQALAALAEILERAETKRSRSISKNDIGQHTGALALESVRTIFRKNETLSPVFEAVKILGKTENAKTLAQLYATIQASVTGTIPVSTAKQIENDQIREHILETLAGMDTEQSAAAIKDAHTYNHSRNGADGIAILADEILIEKLSSMSNPAAPGVIAQIGAPDFQEEGLTPKTAFALNRLVAYYNAHARGKKENTPERQAVMKAVITLAENTFLGDPDRFRAALDGGLKNGNTITYDPARKPSEKTIENLGDAAIATDLTQMFSRKISPLLADILDEHAKKTLRQNMEQGKLRKAVHTLHLELTA